MSTISYCATDAEQERIDSIVKHSGKWYNPEDGYYVMYDCDTKTESIISLLVEDVWIDYQNN